MTDRLEDVVNQEKSVLKQAARQAYAPPPHPPPAPTFRQHQRQETLHRRQARLDKHRAVVTQNAHLPVKEQIKIAGICRNTYYNWKRRTTLPQRKPLPRRDRLVDAFVPYLQTRWEAGCHNGARLFAEIKEQGFTGTYGMVSYFLSQWRWQLKQRQAKEPLHTPSPRESVWLLLKPKEKQSPQQQRFTQTLCQLSPRLQKAQALVLDFFRVVRERDVPGLDVWLKAVAQCEIAPLHGCLRGMSRDKAAIVAALSYEWSNGQLEGQVNRLKLVKRSMYGRAKWDLLRARVLPMAQAA